MGLLPALAQKPVASFSYPGKSLEDFLIFKGSQNQVGMYFEMEDSYFLQVLDSNFSPKIHYTYPKSASYLKGYVMDVVWHPSGKFAYALNQRNKQLTIAQFNDNEKLEIISQEFLPEYETPLKGFGHNGLFVLFTLDVEQKKLMARVYQGTGTPIIYIHSLPTKYNALSKWREDERINQPPLSDYTVALVRDMDYNFLDQGIGSKKVYAFDSLFYFIFDEANDTHVLEFDANKGSFEWNTLSHNRGYYYKTENRKGVSYPCQGHLLRLNMGIDEEISLKIMSLKSLKTVKTLTITPKNQNRYLAGPPIEEVSVNQDSPTLRPLKSYEPLQRKWDDNLVLVANAIRKDVIEIFAGSYEKTVSVQYMNNPGYYGGMGVGIGMGMSTPMYSTPYTTTTERSVYIRTYVEGKEWKYSEEGAENIRQKVQAYEEKVSKNRGEAFDFQWIWNGKVFYCYSNRRSNSIQIISF